jgi:4-hydroxy-tetrahydrodipicolinate reductase
VHKLDHPSGTAITLGEQIVEALDRKEAWAEDTTDPRLLRIDHIRRGEVPGIHTIRYDSPEDIITITHDAHSRRGFALGAVLAAEYTAQHQGLLTISDMMGSLS